MALGTDFRSVSIVYNVNLQLNFLFIRINCITVVDIDFQVSWIISLTVLLSCLVQLGLCQNVKVEYYSNATLICDNNQLNLSLSDQAGVVSKYWMLPGGSLVDNTSKSDMVELHVPRWTLSPNFANFNLTLNRVDDEDFGMYTCVIVYSDGKIKTVRRGLNVDGADFSKLLETYRENAIIGGIAAAGLFVVFSASCVIWHCRYSSRGKEKEGLEQGDPAQKTFDNGAMEVEETNHL